MKKNRINTTSIREIKSSFKRFLSLLVMSMLGVGVFVGLTSASPDMLKSIDSYYDKNDLYDIKVVSTLGLTDLDVKELNKLDTVNVSAPSSSKDVISKIGEDETVIKILETTKNLNKISVINGRMPKYENEILVEEAALKKEKVKIGDIIQIADYDTFKNNKFKIVGTVKSPLYINNVTASTNRGNTTLGTGKIDYYAYVLSSAFKNDYYTEIYLTVKDAKKENTNSKEYLSLVNKILKQINTIKTKREEERYNFLYNEAKNEIDKKEKEGLEKLNTAKKSLDSAEVSLKEGKKKLEDSKKILDSSYVYLSNSKKQLDNAKNELDVNNQKLEVSKETINNNVNEYDITYNEIEDFYLNNKELIDDVSNLDIENITYEEFIDFIKEDQDEFTNLLNYLKDNNAGEKLGTIIKDNITEEELQTVIEKIQNGDIPTFEEVKNNYISKKEDVKSLIEGIKTITESEEKLKDANIEYINYYNMYQNGLSEYNNGVLAYETGLNIYNSNLSVYNSGLEEYNNEVYELNSKIQEAKLKLEEIPKAKWYVYDRLDDTGYSSFIDDGKSVANLAKLFPTIFFIVAVLISLISMSRMVEDDRTLIGTLKSLGFSNKYIRKKYILYSGLATILGGVLGSIIGFFLLPLYIWHMYKLLFAIPVFNYDYSLKYILIGIIIALVCICGTTLLTIKKVVKEKPSDLMRPKAPENGKRVILEKIPFIWNRIKFSNKITIRNLFRYKKRVLMTVVGILGCTALMIAGFGIRDSIVDIPKMQFGKVFHFDDMVYLTKDNNIENDFNDNRIKEYIETKMVTGTAGKISSNLLIVKDEKQLEKILSLRNLNTKQKLEFKENEVIISDKLSSLANKKVGDTISFVDSDGNKIKFIISGICENYAANYIIMPKETYEKMGGVYSTNIVYINLKNIKQEEKVMKDLIDKESVMSIVSSSQTVKNIDDMLKTLNSVVLILIFLSGALSFVVLYNLSYINISERKREIATLKVLGFTHKEVDNYINKETIILTIIGIVLGVIFGVFLSNIIISTIEVDMVRFIHKIKPLSFIITCIITITFTLIVNRIIHYTLKKIDMIESLKSVE